MRCVHPEKHSIVWFPVLQAVLQVIVLEKKTSLIEILDITMILGF